MTVIERETEVDVTFHFMFHFPVLHVVLNKRCQRQTGVFTLCRVLLRDAVRLQCVHDAKQLGKVTVRITKVMAVRHFVSRSRLIAPKSLATF